MLQHMCPYIYGAIYLSLYMWSNISVYIYMEQYICLFIYGAIYLSIYIWSNISVSIHMEQYICLYIYGAIYLSLYIYGAIYLSTYIWSNISIETTRLRIGQTCMEQYICPRFHRKLRPERYRKLKSCGFETHSI